MWLSLAFCNLLALQLIRSLLSLASRGSFAGQSLATLAVLPAPLATRLRLLSFLLLVMVHLRGQSS